MTKKINNLAQPDNGVVKLHAHHLGVDGVATANLLVRTGLHMAVEAATLHAGHTARSVNTALVHQKHPPAKVIEALPIREDASGYVFGLFKLRNWDAIRAPRPAPGCRQSPPA